MKYVRLFEEYQANTKADINEAMGAKSTVFTKPGKDGDIYFSKREGNAVAVRQGDILQSIYVYDSEVKIGKIQKTDKRWENMGQPSEKLLVDRKLKNVGGLATKETQTEAGKLIYAFLSESETFSTFAMKLNNELGDIDRTFAEYHIDDEDAEFYDVKPGKYMKFYVEDMSNSSILKVKRIAKANGLKFRKDLDDMLLFNESEELDEAVISLPGFVLLAIGMGLATRIGFMSDEKLQRGIDVTKATAKAIIRELPIIGDKIKKKEFKDYQSAEIQKYLKDELSDQDIVDIFAENPALKTALENIVSGYGTYRNYYSIIKDLGGAGEYGRAHKKFLALRKKIANGEIKIDESVNEALNEAEKYDLNFKIGDTVDLLNDTWEIIGDMKPNKKFKLPFTFQGEDMTQVPVYPPSTNKYAEGYKVRTVEPKGYTPQYGFFYQYTSGGKLYTKLAISGVPQNESVNEAKSFKFPESFEIKKTIDYNAPGVPMKKLFKGKYEQVKDGTYLNKAMKSEVTLDQDDFTNFDRMGDQDGFGSSSYGIKVNEKTAVKTGDYVLYKGNGTKWVKSKIMQIIPSARKLHIDWNDEYIEVDVKDVKPVKESKIDESSKSKALSYLKFKEKQKAQKDARKYDKKKREDEESPEDLELRAAGKMQKESVNGMSKAAAKKQIKIIDKMIDDETGGDGEPLKDETLQDLERERERLVKLSESVNEAQFKNINKKEHKIKLAIKDVEKKARLKANRNKPLEYEQLALNKIMLSKVLGREELGQEHQDAWEKLKKEYSLEESIINESIMKDLKNIGAEIHYLSDADDDTIKKWHKEGIDTTDPSMVILYSYTNSWPETKKVLNKNKIDFKELEDPNSDGESYIVFSENS